MAMGETWALVPWIDVAAVVVAEEIGVGVGGVVRGGRGRPAGRRPEAAAAGQGQSNDGVHAP